MLPEYAGYAWLKLKAGKPFRPLAPHQFHRGWLLKPTPKKLGNQDVLFLSLCWQTITGTAGHAQETKTANFKSLHPNTGLTSLLLTNLSQKEDGKLMTQALLWSETKINVFFVKDV
jgi:hypothetical protein